MPSQQIEQGITTATGYHNDAQKWNYQNGHFIVLKSFRSIALSGDHP
jgi:hypothetical protein